MMDQPVFTILVKLLYPKDEIQKPDGLTPE